MFSIFAEIIALSQRYSLGLSRETPQWTNWLTYTTRSVRLWTKAKKYEQFSAILAKLSTEYGIEVFFTNLDEQGLLVHCFSGFPIIFMTESSGLFYLELLLIGQLLELESPKGPFSAHCCFLYILMTSLKTYIPPSACLQMTQVFIASLTILQNLLSLWIPIYKKSKKGHLNG